MKASSKKSKGTKFENEIRDLLRGAGVEADRVPGSGALAGEYGGESLDGDVVFRIPTKDDDRLEVRGEARHWATSRWKTLEAWLKGGAFVAVRENRRPPFVFLPFSTLLAVLRNSAELHAELRMYRKILDANVRDWPAIVENARAFSELEPKPLDDPDG